MKEVDETGPEPNCRAHLPSREGRIYLQPIHFESYMKRWLQRYQANMSIFKRSFQSHNLRLISKKGLTMLMGQKWPQD